jgi:hypothetical protein
MAAQRGQDAAGYAQLELGEAFGVRAQMPCFGEHHMGEHAVPGRWVARRWWARAPSSSGEPARSAGTPALAVATGALAWLTRALAVAASEDVRAQWRPVILPDPQYNGVPLAYLSDNKFLTDPLFMSARVWNLRRPNSSPPMSR